MGRPAENAAPQYRQSANVASITRGTRPAGLRPPVRVHGRRLPPNVDRPVPLQGPGEFTEPQQRPRSSGMGRSGLAWPDAAGNGRAGLRAALATSHCRLSGVDSADYSKPAREQTRAESCPLGGFCLEQVTRPFRRGRDAGSVALRAALPLAPGLARLSARAWHRPTYL